MTNPTSPQKESFFKKIRSRLSPLLCRLTRKPQDIEEVMTIIREAEARKILSSETLGMMERIFHVSDMQVREVMIPKAQMVVVKKEDTLEKILPIITESGHSRFPVVDETGNEVIGIMLAKDLLQYCFNHPENTPFNMRAILRKPIFTPQSKRLDILLREFRINRNHIAMVLDEYGNLEGLVTIEDVLEQIVGEIEDEYDIDDEENGHIKELGDGTYIVKATTLIEDFNQFFDVTYSDEEFDTVGGIILKAFGHLPKRGEKIKIAPFRFKVLHSDNRRIYLLEVKKMGKKND